MGLLKFLDKYGKELRCPIILDKSGTRIARALKPCTEFHLLITFFNSFVLLDMNLGDWIC